jgi:hypothetical protein
MRARGDVGTQEPAQVGVIDGQFGRDVTEEGEFGPNAAPAPRRIVPSHAMDQVAHLGVELRIADRISLDFHRQ